MAFRCVVVTPEQQTMDEAAVTQAIIPAHDGLIGIQTDRRRSSSSWASALCASICKAGRAGLISSTAASPR